jgi:hypothetical protein
MNQFDIQKSIQQMQAEIQQLESKIQKKKSKEKFKGLQRFPFFTPFIKAVLLTVVVLLIYHQFVIN